MCYVLVYLSLYARDCPHSDFNKSEGNKVTLFTQEAQKCFLQIFFS